MLCDTWVVLNVQHQAAYMRYKKISLQTSLKLNIVFTAALKQAFVNFSAEQECKSTTEVPTL